MRQKGIAVHNGDWRGQRWSVVRTCMRKASSGSLSQNPPDEPLGGIHRHPPKYDPSRTLKEPLSWGNSRLLAVDVLAEVRALQREDGKDLLAIGSPELVRTLISHGLIDEFRLMIDPVCLGSSKRFFPENGKLLPLRIVESRAVSAGAVLATYERATS